MRALVLSDIHANLEALNAVLAAAEGQWDVLWNLGDLVGYGASPNQVLDLIRPLSTLTVRGNHDRACSGTGTMVHFNPTAREAAIWTFEELRKDNIAWLRDLPQGPLQPLAAGPGESQVSLAHGSPLNEDQYILSMRDAWAPLQAMVTDVTFVGHTHIQGGFAQKGHEWHEIRTRSRSGNPDDHWTMKLAPGTRHLINPGSVGQPRDYDWRAAYVIYDTEAGEVTYYRVPYDVRRAQGRILIARLPERLAARLREGR